MTGSIKPTGLVPPPPPPDVEAKAGKERFDVEALTAPVATPPAAAAPTTEVSRLAEELEAGRISVTQAVDTLVERALSSTMAAGLTPAGRAELEAHLRQSIAEDPSLQGIVRDLSR